MLAHLAHIRERMVRDSGGRETLFSEVMNETILLIEEQRREIARLTKAIHRESEQWDVRADRSGYEKVKK